MFGLYFSLNFVKSNLEKMALYQRFSHFMKACKSPCKRFVISRSPVRVRPVAPTRNPLYIKGLRAFLLPEILFESGQISAFWSLFGLYGLQNRAFRCASGSGVGNALKSHFRRFCRETEGRRSVTREHSNFFITPISYKHEKNISLQVTQSNVIEEDKKRDIEEINKESFCVLY